MQTAHFLAQGLQKMIEDGSSREQRELTVTAGRLTACPSPDSPAAGKSSVKISSWLIIKPSRICKSPHGEVDRVKIWRVSRADRVEFSHTVSINKIRRPIKCLHWTLPGSVMMLPPLQNHWFGQVDSQSESSLSVTGCMWMLSTGLTTTWNMFALPACQKQQLWSVHNTINLCPILQITI